MQAYNGTPRLINLGCAPAVPELVWSVERRKAMSNDRCRGKKRYRGRARRHRREVTSKKALALLSALLVGDARVRNPDGGEYSWREVIERPITDCPGWVTAMRLQARRLLGLAVKHGPASGWGVVQPEPEGAEPKTYTPYWVPKASERCWRWWRHVVLGLERLLTRLARALGLLVPAHRTHLEEPPSERKPVLPERQEEEATPRCRDKRPEPLAEVLARVRRKFGAPPVEGGEEAPIER